VSNPSTGRAWSRQASVSVTTVGAGRIGHSDVPEECALAIADAYAEDEARLHALALDRDPRTGAPGSASIRAARLSAEDSKRLKAGADQAGELDLVLLGVIVEAVARRGVAREGQGRGVRVGAAIGPSRLRAKPPCVASREEERAPARA